MAEGSTDLVHQELKRLGPTTTGQRHVLVAFAATVVLWVAPGLFAVFGIDHTAMAKAYASVMPEGVAAMVGAFMLFPLPTSWKQRRFTLTWEDAAKIDWGIVMLYGGGLALGELAFSTGLATAMGHAVTSWLPSHTTLALTVLFAGAAICLSEAASSTRWLIAPSWKPVDRTVWLGPVCDISKRPWNRFHHPFSRLEQAAVRR